MHFRARAYDPRVGRFTGKDPLEKIYDHFLYASNNPSTRVDPLGLQDGLPDLESGGEELEPLPDPTPDKPSKLQILQAAGLIPNYSLIHGISLSGSFGPLAGSVGKFTADDVSGDTAQYIYASGGGTSSTTSGANVGVFGGLVAEGANNLEGSGHKGFVTVGNITIGGGPGSLVVQLNVIPSSPAAGYQTYYAKRVTDTAEDMAPPIPEPAPEFPLEDESDDNIVVQAIKGIGAALSSAWNWLIDDDAAPEQEHKEELEKQFDLPAGYDVK